MMLTTYLIYLAASLIITVWVGHTLNRNGRVFLVENFHGREKLADSVNHLLLVGFYLVNLGFVLLALKYGSKAHDWVGAVEALSTKVGAVVVVLGIMHFYNMWMLVQFRNSRLFQAFETKPDKRSIGKDYGWADANRVGTSNPDKEMPAATDPESRQ